MDILGTPRNRVIAAIVAAIVLLAGAGAYLALRAQRPAGPVTVQAAPGVEVVLPAGSHAADLHIAASGASAAAVAAASRTYLQPLLAPNSFTATKALPAGTQLRFTVAKGLTSPVFEAVYDPAKRRWVPERTAYDPKTGIATVTVAHFSERGIFTWATDRLKALFDGGMKNLFGPLADTPAEPQCGEANYVGSYSAPSKAIAFCTDAVVTEHPNVGVRGKATIGVSVLNKRRYPMDVTVPESATATTDDPGALTQQLGAALTGAVNRNAGIKHVLLAPGATLRVEVPDQAPPFGKFQIFTAFNGLAYLVGLLGTAVNELSGLGLGSKSALAKTLTDAIAGGKVLARSATELNPADLSPASLKRLGDIGMDALAVVFKDSLFFTLAGLAAVLTGLADAVVATVQGLADTAWSDTARAITFAPYDVYWDPVPDN